jgi:hypothetical protein
MQSLKTESSFTFLTIAKGVISGIAREPKLLLQQFMEPSQHAITPPLQLVEQWASMSPKNDAVQQNWIEIATQAAQWGADTELEACCDWVSQWRCMVGGNRPEVGLRAARRPKPLTLKEQALKELRVIHETFAHQGLGNKTPALDAALKRLGELEALDD